MTYMPVFSTKRAGRYFLPIAVLAVFVSQFLYAFVTGGPRTLAAQPTPTPPSIEVSTINGTTPPFTFSCPDNPLLSPVTITGSGAGSAPPGDASQYHVQVDWGDGNQDNGLGTFTPNSGHVSFTFTYSDGPHTYAAGGNFTIQVKLYHSQDTGNDNQVDSTVSIPVCVTVIPPYDTPYATPYETPYVTPYTTPYETPYATPYETPYATPYITPYATPYETPYATPYETPYATPYITPYSTPYVTPYETPYSTPYSTPYATPSENSSADLAVTKTVVSNSSFPNPGPGDQLVYTVTVTNQGPDTATGVVVHDVLPGDLLYVSSSASQGSYASDNWTVGTLANGASATLTITTTVQPSVAGGTVLTNTARATSTTIDPDSTNNSASASLTVVLHLGGGSGGGGSGGGGGYATPYSTPYATPQGLVLGDSTGPGLSMPGPTGQVLGATTRLPRTGVPLSELVFIILASCGLYGLYRRQTA